VLTEMAINIGSLAYTLKTGNALSAEEEAAIRHISDEAKSDLELLRKVYQDYKANPTAGTLQQIDNALVQIDKNLPALLASAHIRDQALATRINAAVSLILATVSSFAALMPQTTKLASLKGAPPKAEAIPTAKALKAQWNQAIAAPTTNNAAVNAALVNLKIK